MQSFLGDDHFPWGNAVVLMWEIDGVSQLISNFYDRETIFSRQAGLT